MARPVPPASTVPVPGQIDAHIAALGDWRGETLRRMRTLVRAAVAWNRDPAARRQRQP
jgi:hypothetical protein